MSNGASRYWEELKKLAKGGGPKFGDLVENRCASMGNPTRRGVFVRTIYRHGRVNRGKFFEVTDCKGKFWQVNPDAEIYVQKNPATVLELIAEVERLRASCEAMEEGNRLAVSIAADADRDLDALREELSQLKAERDRMAEEVKSLRSCSSIKPKEFDLVRRTEWARLADEAWGYIHTCHRKHGTDFEGRAHAINGLKEMSRIICETLPPRSALNTGEKTDE